MVVVPERIGIFPAKFFRIVAKVFGIAAETDRVSSLCGDLGSPLGRHLFCLPLFKLRILRSFAVRR